MNPGMWSSIARLFTVQASWNYERMVGVGLAHSTEPLLRDLPGGVTGKHYHRALARAGRYFNAHPYMVGLAVGALAREEHDGMQPEKIERLRTALLGPLGSVGDRLVWAGTLPFAAACGLLVAATGHAVWGAVVLLLLHNVVHLPVRIWGLRAGWRLGTRLAKALSVPVLTLALRVVGPAASLALGIAIPIVAADLVQDLDLAARLVGAVLLVLTVLVGRWFAPSLRGVRLGLLAALAALAGGWL